MLSTNKYELRKMPNYVYYYTLNTLTPFWLAESVQWIFEISARDVITADYTVIMSRTLKVTGNHVKFACFVLLPVSEEAKKHFFRSMYNKTIIRFGFCDIQNNQGLGLDYSGYHKNLIQLLFTRYQPYVDPKLTSSSFLKAK